MYFYLYTDKPLLNIVNISLDSHLSSQPSLTHLNTTTKTQPPQNHTKMFAARTARTAARPILQTLRNQQQNQQPFSIMSNLRQFARSFEPHPFQRLPMTSRSAPADWGKLVRRSASQAVVFFPLGFAMLGWPYLGYVALDGKV